MESQNDLSLLREPILETVSYHPHRDVPERPVHRAIDGGNIWASSSMVRGLRRNRDSTHYDRHVVL